MTLDTGLVIDNVPAGISASAISVVVEAREVEVKLPGGTIAVFPFNTPREVIAETIARLVREEQLPDDGESREAPWKSDPIVDPYDYFDFGKEASALPKLRYDW